MDAQGLSSIVLEIHLARILLALRVRRIGEPKGWWRISSNGELSAPSPAFGQPSRGERGESDTPVCIARRGIEVS
jgi:hypothetical protein